MAEGQQQQQQTQQSQQQQQNSQSNNQQVSTEDLQKQIKELTGKLEDVTKESINRKEKLRTLEKESEEAKEASLKEQNKYKELYEAAQPKVKRLEELEPVVQGLLDTKIESIPEDKRHLIPTGTPEAKLRWIEDATTAGLFYPKGGENGGQQQNQQQQVQNSQQRQVQNNNQNLAEYLSWGPDDPRLTTLTNDQYLKWKEHNGKNVDTSRAARNASALGTLR